MKNSKKSKKSKKTYDNLISLSDEAIDTQEYINTTISSLKNDIVSSMYGSGDFRYYD